MDVVFLAGRQVVVDDERHLLDVDTTGEQVGRDENAGGTTAELLHNLVTLILLHVSVLLGKA